MLLPANVKHSHRWDTKDRVHHVFTPTGIQLALRADVITKLFKTSKFNVGFISWSIDCGEHFDFWHLPAKHMDPCPKFLCDTANEQVARTSGGTSARTPIGATFSRGVHVSTLASALKELYPSHSADSPLEFKCCKLGEPPPLDHFLGSGTSEEANWETLVKFADADNNCTSNSEPVYHSQHSVKAEAEEMLSDFIGQAVTASKMCATPRI